MALTTLSSSGTLIVVTDGGTIPTSARLTSSGAFVADVPATGRRWRVLLTDIHGNVYAELDKANVGAITYELNQPESWTIILPQNDPKVAVIRAAPFREIQVWRGDQLLAWGPIVRPVMDMNTFVLQCRGAMYHLGRRYIGKANRFNYLTNPSFESGAAGWNFATNQVLIAYGAPNAQADPPEWEIVTFPTVTGTHSLRLQNSVVGADAFTNQSITVAVNPSTSPDGDVWTLKGYFYLEEAIPPEPEDITVIPDKGAAFQGRGLYLERFSTTQLNPDPAVQAVLPGAPLSLQHEFRYLDEDTPVGVWTRAEVEFTSPPKAGEPEIIEMRLYAPAGVNVYWDAVALVVLEKLAFYGQDQTSVIAKGIVEHLQDPTYEKNDVNISTNCQPSGVLRTIVYPHSDHPGGLDALTAFTKLRNGFDIDMVYTATERIFTTHYPRKGAERAVYNLRLGINVVDFTYPYDGEAAASSVIALGNGAGSDREEGFALAASAFEGGLIVEQVFSAPPETTIDILDDLAAESLTAALNPVTLTVRTAPPRPDIPDPVGRLQVGDWLRATIVRNALDVDETFRIMRLTINTDDTLEMVLNPFTPT